MFYKMRDSKSLLKSISGINYINEEYLNNHLCPEIVEMERLYQDYFKSMSENTDYSYEEKAYYNFMDSIDWKAFFKEREKMLLNDFAKIVFIEGDFLVNHMRCMKLEIVNNKIIGHPLPGEEKYFEISKEQSSVNIFDTNLNADYEILSNWNFDVWYDTKAYINQYIKTLYTINKNIEKKIDIKKVINKLFNLYPYEKYFSLEEAYANLDVPDKIKQIKRILDKRIQQIDLDKISNFSIINKDIKELGSLIYYDSGLIKNNEKKFDIDRDNVNTFNSPELNPLSSLAVEKILRWNDSTQTIGLDKLKTINESLKLINFINNGLNSIVYSKKNVEDNILSMTDGFDYKNPYHTFTGITYEDFLNYYNKKDSGRMRYLYELAVFEKNSNQKLNKYMKNIFNIWAMSNKLVYSAWKYNNDSLENLSNINNTIRDVPEKVLFSFLNKKERESEEEILKFKIIKNLSDKELIYINYAEYNHTLAEMVSSIEKKHNKIMIKKLNMDFLLSFWETCQEEYKESNVKMMLIINDINKSFARKINKKLKEEGSSLKEYFNIRKENMLKHSEIDFSRKILEKHLNPGAILEKSYLKLLLNFLNKNLDNITLINNINFLNKELNIDLNDLLLKSPDNLHYEESNKESIVFSTELSVLDYFLFLGNSDVSKFIIQNDLCELTVYKEGFYSSLDISLLSCCDNSIIDLIIKNNKIYNDTCYKSNIMGFVPNLQLDSVYTHKKSVNDNSFFPYSNHRKDIDILNKMKYAYDNYGVDFNYLSARLFKLWNSEDNILIIKNLGINKKTLLEIELAVEMVNAIHNYDYSFFEKKINAGELNFLTSIIINDLTKETEQYNSGLLNLLFNNCSRYNYPLEKMEKHNNFYKKLFSSLIKITNKNDKYELAKLMSKKRFGESQIYNLSQFLINENLFLFREEIKDLCMNFGFNIEEPICEKVDFYNTDDDIPVNENFVHPKMVLCNNSYEEVEFENLVVEINKEKITQEFIVSNIKTKGKRI